MEVSACTTWFIPKLYEQFERIISEILSKCLPGIYVKIFYIYRYRYIDIKYLNIKYK